MYSLYYFPQQLSYKATSFFQLCLLDKDTEVSWLIATFWYFIKKKLLYLFASNKFWTWYHSPTIKNSIVIILYVHYKCP